MMSGVMSLVLHFWSTRVLATERTARDVLLQPQDGQQLTQRVRVCGATSVYTY